MPNLYSMIQIETLSKKGLLGGKKVCKNCGQTKTLLSTYTCPGTTKPHVWVKA